MNVMTSDDFCTKLIDVVKHYKTMYVNGGIGYRLNAEGKNRASKNKKNLSVFGTLKSCIAEADIHTWAFDCNNLLLAVSKGWVGDEDKVYGGANFNNVHWYTTEALLNACSDVSSNFNIIERGELVWIQGHVGCYIGNGIVVESTPKWNNGVQFTNLGNLTQYKKGNYRVWNKHGKLPFISYNQTGTTITPQKKSNDEIAREVIRGLWGNGSARKRLLTEAGYDYKTIQGIVNKLMKGK